MNRIVESEEKKKQIDVARQLECEFPQLVSLVSSFCSYHYSALVRRRCWLISFFFFHDDATVLLFILAAVPGRRAASPKFRGRAPKLPWCVCQHFLSTVARRFRNESSIMSTAAMKLQASAVRLGVSRSVKAEGRAQVPLRAGSLSSRRVCAIPLRGKAFSATTSKRQNSVIVRAEAPAGATVAPPDVSSVLRSETSSLPYNWKAQWYPVAFIKCAGTHSSADAET